MFAMPNNAHNTIQFIVNHFMSEVSNKPRPALGPSRYFHLSNNFYASSLLVTKYFHIIYMIILVNSQPGVSKNKAAIRHKFSSKAFLVCCLNIMCLLFLPLSLLIKVGLNEISMLQVCFVDLYHKLHLTVKSSHTVLYELVGTCRLVVLNF